MLARRGPDQYHVFADFNSCARFYRLSLVSASRRMSDLHFPSSISYAFLNGTINNYQEIAPGYTTDHEVLATAFSLQGTKTFNDIKGAFACCVKPSRDALYLAVDRTGEKTLYWASQNGEVWFSTSSLLLARYLGRQPKGSDGLLFHLALRGQRITESYFEGIYALPPGHCLSVEEGRLDVAPWPTSGAESRAPLLADGFVACLQSRMAHGKLGIALSGGIDSSTLAVAAVQCPELDLRSIATLSSTHCVDFEEDLRHARLLASHHPGLDLESIPYDLNILRLEEPRDFPVLDQDEYGLACLCGHFVTRCCNVLVVGDGADELFCGYDRIFSYALAMDGKGVTADSFSSLFFERYAYSSLVALSDLIGSDAIDPLWRELQAYFQSLADPAETNFNTTRRWFLRHHLFWLLRKADFIAGQHGLESRAPYLHPDIWEQAQTLLGSDFLHPTSKAEGDHFVAKAPLKKIVSGLLPSEILNRKKLPFPVPKDEIVRHLLARFESCGCAGLLPPPAEKAIVSGALGLDSQILFLSFALWRRVCEKFLTSP